MDAVKFLKERNRMCKCVESCPDCPLYKKDFTCDDAFMLGFSADEAVLLVEKWSKEHPKKTRAQDIFEKFPKATRTYENIPKVCAGECGYCGKPSEFGRFEDCDKNDEDCDKC